MVMKDGGGESNDIKQIWGQIVRDCSLNLAVKQNKTKKQKKKKRNSATKLLILEL
jgi:hypothetical protein